MTCPYPYRAFDDEETWIVPQESELIVAADKRQKALTSLDRPFEIPNGEITVAEPGGDARQFE